MNLETIESLLKEIEYLRKKASVVDAILPYYCRETMTFEIPKSWPNPHVFSQEKKQETPASPRHSIANALAKNLPYSEIEHVIDWNRLYETIASAENKKI